MKCLFFCLLTFYSAYLIAQKNDYNWTWSGYAVNDTVLSGNFLNFNNKVRKLTNVPVGIKIGQANASISDDEGNLLFYFNGCRIAGKDHKLIENGDSINYGNALKLIAGEDCLYGYTGAQNSMIIEDPYLRNKYYVLHLTWEKEPIGGLALTKFNYTYVDMNENDGYGKVINKNVVILNDTINSGFLQAVKHQNGKDWWVVLCKDNYRSVNKTNIYWKFLIDNDGIKLHHYQNIGPIFDFDTSASGSAKFSPDGSKYALHSFKNGLWIFDFDRTTGQFSNLDYYAIFRKNRTKGLEWSANGRYLYTSATDSLFQYDTWSNDIGNSETLVDVWDGTLDPFETHFGLMQRGPDCKIYMSSFSSTRSIHVINNPDEPFPYCNFVQHDLKLVASTGTISMPTFPNYRLDSAPVCDPGIVVSSKDIEDLPKIDLKVYPNPATDLFYVESSYQYQDVMVEIRDMNGKICWQGAHHKTMRFSVTDFSDGVYMVLLKKDGLVIGGEKLVVVKR